MSDYLVLIRQLVSVFNTLLLANFNDAMINLLFGFLSF